MENKKIFSRIYEELAHVFSEAINDKIFPGAVVGITLFSDARKESSFFSFGGIKYGGQPMRKNVFFDLASLTKPLATTLGILSLIKNREICLDDYLSDLVEKDMPDDKKLIKLKH
ncbi:MAG TPA: hypothetical protein VE912_20500, partial [Bacteroidales bacterium]|nr:hypothetical protein [Bacteroidales bacterium]